MMGVMGDDEVTGITEAKETAGVLLTRSVTVVFVHGAGHTAGVWKETQAALDQSSLAVNLPGRSGKGGDVAGLTVGLAAQSVVADIETSTTGDVVLVGHSIAGTILPCVAAALSSRVRHLVFVAGITAREGQLPAEIFAPDQVAAMTSMLGRLRTEYAGLPYEELDRRTAHQLDSMNLSCEPMQWADLPSSVPRTFVRSLRDELQNRDLQASLVLACGAQRVIDIDSNHTPATDAPETLAAIVSEIARKIALNAV
jgi:pimeloyl-ACP methyl ester carboxylesterase